MSEIPKDHVFPLPENDGTVLTTVSKKRYDMEIKALPTILQQYKSGDQYVIVVQEEALGLQLVFIWSSDYPFVAPKVYVKLAPTKMVPIKLYVHSKGLVGHFEGPVWEAFNVSFDYDEPKNWGPVRTTADIYKEIEEIIKAGMLRF